MKEDDTVAEQAVPVSTEAPTQMMHIQLERPLPVYTIRGVEVMLDFDLAELYGVTTKRLNEQVRRNLDRFPQDFMFQLEGHELTWNRSQFATGSQRHRDPRFSPFAFTEQGVAMLSSVLNSKRAIDVNIQIMRAFVAMKRESLAFFDEQMDIAWKNDALHDQLATEHRQLQSVARSRLEYLQRADERYGELERIERRQSLVISRVERWITGMEEFGALMVATRLRTIDALVLGYLLRRCSVWDSTRLVWVEATVPHIACSLNWPSIRQVEAAIRRLVAAGLIQREKRSARRIFYFARVDEVIAKLRSISEDVSTPEALIAVSDSLSPLAQALRHLIPLTGNDTPDSEVERIRRLRGDDGLTPLTRPWTVDPRRILH